MALLGVLYVLSFVDRGVLSLLIQPLKADLRLSDLQVGLLYGTAFALFYSVLGVPVARLADGVNRRRMVIVGAIIWGLCTVGSGFVASFLLLNLLRVGLAVGESALTPSAHSMIGDLFPPRRRPFVASAFQTAGFLGASVGTIGVAFLIHWITVAIASGKLVTGFKVWQIVFIAVGAPTLLACAVFAVFAREPARRAAAGEPGATNRELFAYLAKNRRLYIGLFVGAGLMQAIGGGFLAWGPEFLRRSYGWDVRQAASTLGLIGLIVLTVSTLSGPVLTRTLHKMGRPDAVVLVALVGAAVGGVLTIMAYLQTTPLAFILLSSAGGFLIGGGANNILFALQHLAPARMRATLAATLIACFNLFAMGLGPPLAALFSDALSPAGDKLALALALQAAVVMIPSVGLLAWSRRGLLNAMEARRTDGGATETLAVGPAK
jgi:MFS family permease